MANQNSGNTRSTEPPPQREAIVEREVISPPGSLIKQTAITFSDELLSQMRIKGPPPFHRK